MKVPPSNQVDDVIEGDDDDLNDEAPHSPSRDGDFSEYLWLENEEEFDEQIMQQLEEEALMQQCIEAMQDEMNAFSSAGNGGYQNGNSHEDILSCGLQNLTVSQNDDNSSQASKLNPDAAEFVPRTSGSATVPTTPTTKED